MSLEWTAGKSYPIGPLISRFQSNGGGEKSDCKEQGAWADGASRLAHRLPFTFTNEIQSGWRLSVWSFRCTVLVFQMIECILLWPLCILKLCNSLSQFMYPGNLFLWVVWRFYGLSNHFSCCLPSCHWSSQPASNSLYLPTSHRNTLTSFYHVIRLKVPKFFIHEFLFLIFLISFPGTGKYLLSCYYLWKEQ